MNERQSRPQQRFEALLHEHRKIVFKVAGLYAGTAEDRHDLAQEIAAQLWRAFPSYDATRRFSTWMYRIALNVGISFLRREGLVAGRTLPFDEVIAGDEPASPSPDEDVAERIAQLQALIADLDPFSRALILLHLDERSYAEIAEVLGISETNVATKLSRIREQLRLRAAQSVTGADDYGTR